MGESSNSYSPTAKGKRCDIEAANSTGSNSNSSSTANDVIEGVGPENEEEEDEKANKTGERSALHFYSRRRTNNIKLEPMSKRPEEQGEDADLSERVPMYQHVWKSVAGRAAKGFTSSSTYMGVHWHKAARKWVR